MKQFAQSYRSGPPAQEVDDCSKMERICGFVFSSLESLHQAPLISCVPKVSSRAFGNAQVTHCLPTRPIGYDPLLAVRILA